MLIHTKVTWVLGGFQGLYMVHETVTWSSIIGDAANASTRQ